MCHNCCKPWPGASLPASFVNPGGASSDVAPLQNTKVCVWCDASAEAFRTALLAGDADGARRVYEQSGRNINLRCPMPGPDFARSNPLPSLMLPVHLAAAAGCLPALRWLVEEEFCPVGGTALFSHPLFAAAQLITTSDFRPRPLSASRSFRAICLSYAPPAPIGAAQRLILLSLAALASKVYFTSAEVKSAPSWNLTSRTRLKV